MSSGDGWSDDDDSGSDDEGVSEETGVVLHLGGNEEASRAAFERVEAAIAARGDKLALKIDRPDTDTGCAQPSMRDRRGRRRPAPCNLPTPLALFRTEWRLLRMQVIQVCGLHLRGALR